MLRQQGHPPVAVDWPGWAGCAACACVAVGWAPHIIGLAAAVVVVWAAAWFIIGQARTGVAANPAATARAIVIVLIVASSCSGPAPDLIVVPGPAPGNTPIGERVAVRPLEGRLSPSRRKGQPPLFFSHSCISAISFC
jgi:hypothetical protein